MGDLKLHKEKALSDPSACVAHAADTLFHQQMKSKLLEKRAEVLNQQHIFEINVHRMQAIVFQLDQLIAEEDAVLSPPTETPAEDAATDGTAQ